MQPTPFRTAILVLFLLVSPALAQEAPRGDGERPRQKDQAPTDKLSVTEHELTVDGTVLRYKATAGTIAVKDESGKHKADVFFVAYEKRTPRVASTQPATAPSSSGSTKAGAADAGAPDPANRPITFVFNGGPGAASVWLHLGTAGPKRVLLTEEGAAPPPPFETADNPWTWLDATDLVFIDPVGTGYSRPAPGEKQEQFSGVQEDIASVADFIRLYTTRNNRWPSPKFLAGESYGTTRAAGLSQHLLDQHALALNGILFVSTVLDFQTISFAGTNDLPYALFLPTYTATAHYHKKLPPDLQNGDVDRALRECERWAIEQYMPLLAKGSAITPDERAAGVRQLSRFTGLPPAVVEKTDLKIDTSLFRKMLLVEDGRKIAGRFDSRLLGYDPDPLSRDPDFDPSFTPFFAAYAGAFNHYARATLRYESDLQYEVLTGRVHPWNYGRAGSGYLSVSNNLASSMRKNPHLKVLFASGIYDLATPYFGTTYTARHLDVGPDLRKNITETFYPGGHMMYHHRPTLAKLHDDVKRFIEASVPER